MRIPGTFADLLWVPGCSCDGLKVLGYFEVEVKTGILWFPSSAAGCSIAVGAGWQEGDSPLRSQEFWGESSYQLWWWQTIHLFLLPQNLFWIIILPAPKVNTIYYIILSLGSSGWFMVLTKKHGWKPKGKTKVSKSDIIEIWKSEWKNCVQVIKNEAVTT